MNKIFSVFLIFALYCYAQADQLTDKLSALKNEGLIPLKTKLGQLKDALGKLEYKLSHPAEKEVETFVEKRIEKRFAGLAFNKAELEKYAEGYVKNGVQYDGYGYKTANLHELQKVAAALKTSGLKAKIQVPDFVGISSHHVKEFLKNRGYNIETAWTNFIKNFSISQRQQFFETKNFSPQFLHGLKQIEDRIKQIFEQAAQQAISNNENFNFDQQFDEAGINETIERIKQKKSSLIVRSTGKEDTDTLSNAGGNESVPNVAPIASDILRAMGVGEPGKTGVVSSYFSEKSFIQRLDGGDTTLFDLPFTPVLIQRMVGERVHGLRSDNVKAFLKSKGISNFASYDQIRNAIMTLIAPVKLGFNKAFKADEAQIDEMLQQAATNGWKVDIRSPDGKEVYTVDAVGNFIMIARSIAKVIDYQMNQAVSFDAAYCAVVIEPVLAGQILERKLPACGVMFTEEAEGGISKKDLLKSGWNFSKQARSTGITLIQASYGHNEGVVNSLVGVDSYFVTDIDSIYSVIRSKPFRKFPSLKQGTKLEDRGNPRELVNASALSVSEVSMLKTLAIALERYYRKPMDVEYVIDRSENVVYLVQARPLVHNKEKVEPSYFQNLAAFNFPQYKGLAIGVAGGALRVITEPDHVIAKPTMGEALDAYLKHKNKEAIRCVIVGEHAPATSHEATQFRTAVKPVIFVPQFSKIEEALERKSILAVDVQQETIIEWQDPEFPAEFLMQKGFLVQGWRNYPISPELSLIDNAFIDRAVLDHEYSQFLSNESKAGLDKVTLASLGIATGKKQKNLTPNIAKNCLDLMREDDEKKALTALIVLLGLADRKIKSALGANLGEDFERQIVLLKSYLLSIGRNLVRAFGHSKNSDGYMKRLYYLRFLEALLYQQPQASQVLYAGSLAQSIFKEAKQEKKIITDLKNAGADDIAALVKTKSEQIENFKKAGNYQILKTIDLAKAQVQLAKAQKIALTPQLGQQWIKLIANFRKISLSDSEQKDFIEMLNILAQFEMLPVWLHTSFASKFNQMNLKNTVQQLIQEFQFSKNVFDLLKQKVQEIAQLKPELFADSKTYKAQQTLLTNLVTYFTSPTFSNLFNSGQQLGKMAMLFMLERFVDIFDQSIKASKVQKSVPIFKEMIVPYMDLLKSTCNLQASGSTALYELGEQNKLLLVGQALNLAGSNDNQMNNSPNFDVNISVIGSKANFKPPQTLEDIFTFIHQSLINVNSWLMQKVGLNSFADENSSILPDLLKNVLKEFYLIRKNKNYVANVNNRILSLVGINFKYNILQLKFNYPLRSHSSTITLDYIAGKRPFVRINCTTSGENEWGRFYRIGEYARTVAGILKLDCEIRTAKNAVSFSWNVTQEEFAQIQLSYPNKQVLAKALEWANDGPEPSHLPHGNGRNGLSYATDGFYTVNTIEDHIFNFIVKVLLNNDVNQKDKFAEMIVDWSLNQNCVHMFIDRVLALIKPNNKDVWVKVLRVMQKLLTKNSWYAVHSDLSFFRFYRTPKYSYIPYGDLGDAYYDVTSENLYETLTNKPIESTKDDSSVSLQILQNLKIDSFMQAFARFMFNAVCSQFNLLSDPIKIEIAKFMQHNSDFFASLRDVNPSAVSKYASNERLRNLLNDNFFTKNKEGILAKKLIALAAQSNNTLNKQFLFAINKSLSNEEYESILKNYGFSWVENNVIAGMAFPNYAAIQALKAKGINCVVTLTDEASLPANWFDPSIENIRIPIQDFSAPTIGQVNQVLLKIAGKRAVVHCAGGLGRTGTLLACWLVKNKNMTALQAIKRIRDLRPDSIETKEQEEFIKQFEKFLKSPGAYSGGFSGTHPGPHSGPAGGTPAQLSATVVTSITNYALGVDLNQNILNAVQEIKTKKAIAQTNNQLKQALQDALLCGYFWQNQIRPNMLELYKLVSEGIITDSTIVNAAKERLLGEIGSIGLADTLAPNNPDQRKKFAAIAAEFLQKKILSEGEVLQVFNSANGRRLKLLVGYVLLLSGYKKQPFLDEIKNYAQEQASQGVAYQALAQDCTNLAFS